MLKKALKNERGLTLIELLAVIVILGIIAAIAIPAIGNIIQNSREDAVKADAIQVLEGAKLMLASEDVTRLDSDGDNVITWDDGLSRYVDLNQESDGTDGSGNGLNPDTIEVTYSSNSIESVSATGYAGDVTLTFSDATLEDINSDNGEGTRTIPNSES
jgi:type IV pilus assembly protein PilA